MHFFAQFILLPACDDANYEKQNLTEAEQIIKLDFYLRVQNTKIFILSAMSLQVWQRLTGVYYSADNICWWWHATTGRVVVMFRGQN